jgi:hypothetical protein
MERKIGLTLEKTFEANSNSVPKTISISGGNLSNLRIESKEHWRELKALLIERDKEIEEFWEGIKK